MASMSEMGAAILEAEEAVVSTTASMGDVLAHLEEEVAAAKARLGVAVITMMEAKQARTKAKGAEAVKVAQRRLSVAKGLLEAFHRSMEVGPCWVDGLGVECDVAWVRPGLILGAGEVRANALLIAAAPDLLEALEAISRAGTLNDQAVIDQMIAALAKARGGR